MRITVNDEQVTIDPPCSISDLLRQYRLAETPCAVEVNKSLVPKREHDAHEIQEGDVIEIVTLVGGG